MVINHSALFNRYAENFDFAALWQVEDAVMRELQAAKNHYDAAKISLKYAGNKHNRNSAFIELYYAKTNYLKTKKAYDEFWK